MSRPQFPAAVLWDMDGTLIDSEHYWLESESSLARDYGSEWTAENGLELIGMSLYDSSKILKQRLGIQNLTDQEVIDRLTASVVRGLRDRLPWRPGALELLTELKANGIKTALVTMSMRSMAMTVVDQIPFEAFDVVIAGDDVEFGKPHPEPYLLAASALGVDPADCFAIEDSRTGLTSAELAGTVAIGVPNIVPIEMTDRARLVTSLTELNLAEIRRRFGGGN